MRGGLFCVLLFLSGFLFAGTSAFCAEKPVTVDVFLEKDVGYFIGDLVEVEYRFLNAEGWRLEESKLPKKGFAIYSWLELRDVKTEKHKVIFVFQVFAVANDKFVPQIPGFRFWFKSASGDKSLEVLSHAVSVMISPLTREGTRFVLSPAELAYNPFFLSKKFFQILALAIFVFGFLGFLKKMKDRYLSASPFREALKKMKYIQNDGYLAAFIILREALNQKTEKAVFANNVGVFLQKMSDKTRRLYGDEILSLVKLSDQYSFDGTAEITEGIVSRPEEIVKRVRSLLLNLRRCEY